MKQQDSYPPFIIRGIKLYGFRSMSDCLAFLLSADGIRHGMLVAINAEKVLLTEENPQLAQIISQSEINYPDGISVVRSINKKYPGSQVVRIAGIDLWYQLMQQAGVRKLPVFLVGSSSGTVQQVSEKLINQWQVPVVGHHHGYFESADIEVLLQTISQIKPRIVTVAMGSPQQELFIARARQCYPEALYMGVGGTYDVYIGKVKRAPVFWQKLGLEWLYRLCCQPRRWRRQIKLLRFLRYYCFRQL
jgi:UDP-N-acetyl-D-mannosaminouronate:lipid I N-acetyl-D-mannosaminouronosyltransferase